MLKRLRKLLQQRPQHCTIIICWSLCLVCPIMLIFPQQILCKSKTTAVAVLQKGARYKLFKSTGDNKEKNSDSYLCSHIKTHARKFSVRGWCTHKYLSERAQISPKQTPTELRSVPNTHSSPEDADIWWQSFDMDTGSQRIQNHSHLHQTLCGFVEIRTGSVVYQAQLKSLS